MNVLNLDVIALIVEYITDIRDVISLWNTNKFLFHNVMRRYVKKIHISPSKNLFFPKTIIKRFPYLTSFRGDIRIENCEELTTISRTKVNEMCLRISSKEGPELLYSVSILMCYGYLKNRCFRLERWNKKTHRLDHVWIGKGKISHDSLVEFYPFLIIYRKYLEQILTYGDMMRDNTYIEILLNLPKLKKIYYMDFGYSLCTNTELTMMINLNENIETIEYIPASYIYEIDNTAKFFHVDKFISDVIISNNIYKNILEMIIPMGQYNINNLTTCFPNLKRVGIRYVHMASNNNITLIKSINRYNLTIFVYLVFDTEETKQENNRDPYNKFKVSNKICCEVRNIYPRANIVDMSKNLPSIVLARDNWLFDTVCSY